MENKTPEILTKIAGYFAAKLAEHGATPGGVGWNGEESQLVRFDQLIKIINRPVGFSINDLGCGYGLLYHHLNSRYKDFTYNGYDISEAMIRAAKDRFAHDPKAHFSVAARPLETADYGIASGIFNVRLERSDAEWSDYLKTTLDELDRTSRRGFAFNCLTSYSDREKMQDYLYYADPCALFDLCKRRYSRQVALLHDYGLYDFTILVRKAP